MSPQRRGATEEPIEDYHDTGLPVTDARTRPPRDAGKRTRKTGHPSSSNKKGTPMIASPSTPVPEGFVPVEVPRLRTVLATELQGRVHVVDRGPRELYAGPRHLLPIGVTIEELWTPGGGHVLRRADTAELIPAAAIRAALRALVDGWTEISRHARLEVAPADWVPIQRRDGLLPTCWRGPVFAAPGGAIPGLQARWTAVSGAYLVRTDTGGALVRADVQGTLAGLRSALEAL